MKFPNRSRCRFRNYNEISLKIGRQFAAGTIEKAYENYFLTTRIIMCLFVRFLNVVISVRFAQHAVPCQTLLTP